VTLAPTYTIPYLSYIDPDAHEWILSDLGLPNGYVCTGISGATGIPVSLQSIPVLGGTAVPLLYLPQPNTLTLGVYLETPPGGTENDYYKLLDAFVRAFYNRRNDVPAPGYLVVGRPDGTKRQLAVYCIAGLDTADHGILNAVYGLSLEAPDPHWQDQQAQQVLYSLSTATGILPLLPVFLGGGTVLGTSLVVNDGGAIAYPVWTITGPGTPTIQNITTGRQWSLGTAIPAGQIVTVSTVPNQQYVYNNTTATSWWNNLVISTSRDLWSLQVGDNQINIQLSGATANSSIQLSWTRRWQRA
jgi:hypothetical protein